MALGTFGSYAIGSARAQSDLDLFVIKERTPAPSSERARTVRRLLFGVMHPVDIHVFTPEEFEETASEELSFTWVIACQARLYYWKPETRMLVPSLFTLRISCVPASSRW